MTVRPILLFPAVLLLLHAAPAAAQEACGPFPRGSASHSCTCASGAFFGAVWGAGPFTADSDICTAARFSGLIGEEGGTVTLGSTAGMDSYEAATANGITTSAWGAYGESFQFIKAAASGLPECDRFPAAASSHACTCAAGFYQGAVWGSDPYTADSYLCAAALHAGIFGPDGGALEAVSVTGLERFSGSLNNGVTSSSWGSYSSAITFNRN